MINKLSKLLYRGHNFERYSVKSDTNGSGWWIVSWHRGEYLCECSIIHKRKLGKECKHINLIRGKRE